MAMLSITAEQGAVALATFALWEVHKAYVESCPSMHDLRRIVKDTDEYWTAKQKLIDADITIGGVVVIAAILGGILSRSLLTPAVVVTVFGFLALYHHSILASRPI